MIGRVVGFALLLLAAGCSRPGAEPSQDDIRAALKQANYRGGPQAEKLACKTSPERPGVICDYRAPACNRYTGTCGSAKPFTGRFLHSGGRWQLVEDLTPRAQQDPVTQPLPGVVLPTPAASPTAAAPEAGEGDAPIATGPVVEPDPGPEAAPPRRRNDPPEFDSPDYDQPAADGRDAPLSIQELGATARWIGLNTRCRGGSGDSARTVQACEDRDRLTRRLEGQGLCNTRTRGWRRCE